MKSGNIFIEKEGTNVTKIEVAKRNDVFRDYYIMRENADADGDRFFHINAQEWEDFYGNLWTPDDPYWDGVDMTFITSLQVGAYPISLIDDVSEFEKKPDPKSHGGFAYCGHPMNDYIYNKETWNEWHDRWNLSHINDPDADALYNGVWPCYDKIIEILSQELSKAGKRVPPAEKDVVNSFHEDVMKCLDERGRISASKRIGAIICEANYYIREKELEKLEAKEGNGHAERIYSIKLGGKYQFLSIDKQHGMLELCDDKGDHQMEIRFDGTKNKGKETDHSLLCVAEWKKNFNK